MSLTASVIGHTRIQMIVGTLATIRSANARNHVPKIVSTAKTNGAMTNASKDA